MTDKQNYFTFIDNTSDNNSKIMEYLRKEINYEQNSVIIDGVDVSECQHINAYNPKNPICQRGVGVGGSASVCDARCRYADEYRYKQQLKAKEQECERFKEENAEIKKYQYEQDFLQQQLDQLKAEVKSKTEYIQEQREIIDQYSKEIEMYKKCQGKRASKREEELEAENERLDNEAQNLFTEKTNLEIEIKELKAENERLKKEIRLYDCIDKWGTEQCRCACRCLGSEFCNDADKKINKLKQAIEKIKEICKTNVCKHCHSKLKVDDNYCKNIKDCDCYNILQICEEVNDV